MRSFRRRPLLVPVLLCAIAVLAARPTTGAGDPGDGSGVSARVAHLYREAFEATQRYEAGRHAAEAQRAQAQHYEELLERERLEMDALRKDLGRIARAQYRNGGGLPLTAQILLAGSPDQVMRHQQAFSRANLIVDNAIGKRRRAEARLAADEAKARTAWRTLEKRNAELAALREEIDDKLEQARWQLQDQADAAVAAGSCRGAVRLDQPPIEGTPAWVAPVATYRLSAGFGSGGARWVNRHTGQDFAVPIGTPVRAAGAGRVVKVSCGGAFGIEVVLQHAGGYYTQYAHLAAVAVDQGQRVVAGQWIGQSGTSGNSTGPHLHFEVRVTPEPGSSLDPVPWLAERGVPVG
ncbi:MULTISPECIES: M23 family metallopeptidase [unclassified Streptomyces]|uniref:M23 family metallopeptidase n=1 Tax=unclassified Streptomyces TaxID=2593676 RepID=UPI001F041E21|nr:MULTISPECIES: M23 family metallopeptidase [unclassified Streptomyces]MCH0564449.1 M23 family metallopeptidase [Streptomyces sp. MUM 2J]MCH0569338.1 M23 family metallopeptidase [Streptomyces sp. MUM 136J]